MSLTRTEAIRREIRVLMLEQAWAELTTNEIADRIERAIDDAHDMTVRVPTELPIGEWVKDNSDD